MLTRALLALALVGVVALTGLVSPAGGSSARAPLPGYLTAPAKGQPAVLALAYLRDHDSRQVAYFRLR